LHVSHELRNLTDYRLFACFLHSFYHVFNAIGNFEPTDRMQGFIGVVWRDLGTLSTARAREFWICWRQVMWDFEKL